MAIDTGTRPGGNRQLRPGGNRPSWITGTPATVRGWLDHPSADQVLLLTVVGLLLFLGLMMVLSASSVLSNSLYDGNSYVFFGRQLAFAAIGVVIGAAMAVLPASVSRRLAWFVLLVSLVGLLATYSPIGLDVNGNRNWIDVGPFRGQPSEFAKLAMVWWGADVLARRDRELDQLRRIVWPYLIFCGVLIGLVTFQHDLGSAVIMVAIVVTVLWVAGVPLLVFGAIGTGAAVVVGTLVVTAPYRMARLMSFLRPTDGIDAANYQSTMGSYALASGGWWGLKLGGSRMKWGGLPEAHTDYILAIIGEELGLLGTCSVVALFALLGWAGIRIMRHCVRPYHRYLAAGVTGWILFQAFVNIAVVVRLWPVMGVTLPFISYGGSSVLATLVAVGLLMSCARAEPAAVADRQRRRREQERIRAAMRVSAVVDVRPGPRERSGDHGRGEKGTERLR